MKKQIAPSVKAYLIRGASYLLLLVSASTIPFAFGQWHAHEQRGLTFAERVDCQRAIEEVYWRHRIWPKENPNPKLTLDGVMPQAQLEEKVADYLRMSQALEDYWQRPITAKQLQDEMDRMAKHTKQPEVLQELFDTLGNDPFVIAECLARPALAERLLTDWYAYNQRFHRELKNHAEADLQRYNTIKQMKHASGSYDEVEFIKSNGAQDVVNAGTSHGVKLNSPDWDETVQMLAAAFNQSDLVKASALGVRRDVAAEYRALPLGKLTPVREDETRYYVTAVIEKTDKHLKLATVSWLKETLHSWLAKAETHVRVTMAAVSAHYTLPGISGYSDNSIPSVGCTVDTWTPTERTNVPDPRDSHTTVWTGSEMIVWGGYPHWNTGGRYNPSTDSWTAISTTNAPTGRYLHTAVWTGSEMIVWGGYSDTGAYFNTGGRYNPGTDTWTATSVANAPDRRNGHTAVWTGSEMIVWGGYFNDGTEHYLNTGGRYNPSADTWAPTSATSAPDGRRYHTAVWTGSEMIVWGGGENPYSDTGGRYNPITDSWTATSTTNAPSAREVHTAVWTGTEMIVWGGFSAFGEFNTGGRYDPSTDAWTATSLINAPTGRDSHTAVWTGSEMIVWGGTPDASGGRYNPSSDSWTATSLTDTPEPRYRHRAVWTGSEMIVWGGLNSPSGFLNTGGKYDPSTDSWTATSTTKAPTGRYLHTAVWTGSEMIVWGGLNGFGGYLDTGGRYKPSTDNWTTTSTSDAPAAREFHTAVWTGSEMIIWGGLGNGSELNTGSRYNHSSISGPSPTPTPLPYLKTGGRYNPSTDSWIATSTTNAPDGRYLHTAVWSDSEMIVWGGFVGSDLNTGGRYNPRTDSWTATSVANAPAGRSFHTAVWTGSEMIAWGGGGCFSGCTLNTGGRYNPTNDSWTATSTTNAPAARFEHTAVWSGSEMIVWGGRDGFDYYGTGGRYDPNTDSWTATSITNAPSARSTHAAVWTGSEMIEWGGYDGFTFFDTGGRYDPLVDSWTATSTIDAPSARYYPTAVWTGSEMIVWGGSDANSFPISGGRYCAQSTAPTPTPTPTATPRITPRPRPSPHPRL